VVRARAMGLTIVVAVAAIAVQCERSEGAKQSSDIPDSGGTAARYDGGRYLGIVPDNLGQIDGGVPFSGLPCESRDISDCEETPECEVTCGPGGGPENCTDTCEMRNCVDFAPDECPRGPCILIVECGGTYCAEDFEETRTCGEHGYYGWHVPCCEGVVRRCGAVRSGTCDLTFGVAQCLACGNGECEIPEDHCNCPEDCPP
jgi:hypothetical protein